LVCLTLHGMIWYGMVRYALPSQAVVWDDIVEKLLDYYIKIYDKQ